MTAHCRITMLLGLAIILSACQPSAGSPVRPEAATPGQAAAPSSGRALVFVARAEAPNLHPKPLQSLGFTTMSVVRLFNAGLTMRDGGGQAIPYLAEALPRLNSETWRLFEDGRMETSYTLRSGLTWHDGTPLSADDFIFAWRVFLTPDFGYANAPPISLIDDIAAPDARTLRISWKRPFFEAGTLDAGEGSASRAVPPLPRHIFERPFTQGALDAFSALPAWNTEYVGAGPFQVDRWEAGSFFEAAAFEGHALGKPKISRIRVRFIPDFNTSVANMLSGETHINVDDSLRMQQGLILKREWVAAGKGTLLVYPGLWRWSQIQQRPEYANPRDLMDARVRKALNHSVDKAAINGALFEGEGIMAETMIPATVEYFRDLDRAVIKYPYDLRRTEQLMAEAGFSKGGDGMLQSSAGARFAFELAVLQSPVNESEMAIMAAGWRVAGIDVKEVVWPAVAARDAELRNTHGGLSSTGGRNGEDTLAEHSNPRVPTAQNRWIGSNRGGWLAPPEFTRLDDEFSATLDPRERIQRIIQMATAFTEGAAVVPLYFSPTVTAFVTDLTGPQVPPAETSLTWNVHQWEFR